MKTALEGFNAIKTNEIENLEVIEMGIVTLNVKIKIERLRNTLDEFEINELETKLNAEIEILEGWEKQAIKNTINIEKLKPKLREMETIETKFISHILIELIKAI